MEDMMHSLAKRRRTFQLQIGLIGLAMLGWTGMIVHAFLIRQVADAGREWGAAVMLLLSWGVFAIIVRQYLRHHRADAAMPASVSSSVPDALRALIDDNAAARRRIRTLGYAFPLFAGALALSLFQLLQVGKMTPSNLRDAAILMGGALLLSAATFAWRYFRDLTPEARRLKRLLSDYES
ncbi:hypothetical protein C7I55_19330 [Sphingomonas deserti]|uniref:Uncharacterized protein n=2 Tax=Allosphingosinicella deserti TaxID=2116704 RepID=A0A2P7QKT5_9SPHN|nr:hypothetical protein C7I55_19330 [Sphingomonas deserti]